MHQCPREEHSLLREFCAENPDGSMQLVQSRADLQSMLSDLEVQLAEVCERIDSMSLRGVSRLRRTLEVVRSDMVEVVEALDAWMPLDEGRDRKSVV